MRTVEEPDIRTWDFPRGIASIAVMADFAAEHGVDADRVLAGTGLAPAALTSPELQVPAVTELVVVRNLVRELADVPALGAQVGRRYRLSTFGIFGFACVTSPTLREAISLALRYYQLGYGFCTPVVESGDDGVLAWIHHDLVPADVARFLVERDVVAMHRVLGDLLGHELTVARIEFDFETGDSADRLHEILGVAPEFGRAHTVFTLDPTILAQALPQANAQTWSLCVAQCAELLQQRTARTGITAEVRALILPGGDTALIPSPPTIEVVARELGTSPRTLRRRLTAAGTGYRALVDEVRCALAEEMLTGTPLSIDDIAVRLGYAEATPFIHAFKRWTGTTPSAYRRQRVR
ncbi:AraC family transcriptional regulator [Nocardia sp. MH4]|uniref:AraC family transcriptional regulator n=1 Tax=Nocardia sp. MH4 TaxID=1768677 RepID=UPI001C4FB92A|nr:AraC family transcriptional regulator [Nocardia sp. MH4]MBW0274139.1 AraC family transcriptional regulator [Nocardia sp. MH4]